MKTDLLHKTIFTYWHQGFDAAPPVVKACARNLIQLHPGWEIHLLDQGSAPAWLDPIRIPDHRWQQLSLAHRSDLIRTQLLIKHGGVWADPTVWFTRPLDNWLPDQMPAGLFLYRYPGRDRAISNWFIAAETGNRLLMRLYDKLCKYWAENQFENFDRPMGSTAHFIHRILSRNTELPRLWLNPLVIRLFRTFPYMIYHYAFYDLVRTDAECRAIWDRMPAVPADGPVGLLRHGLNERFDDVAKCLLLGPDRAPLYKLTWKGIPQRPAEDTVLGFLVQFAQNEDNQFPLMPQAAVDQSIH